MRNFCLVFIALLLLSNAELWAQSKGKNNTLEQVEEEETGTGEDGLITDDEGGSADEKKKKLEQPQLIGYPAHDKFAEQTWNYLQSSQEITRLAEFVKMEIVETGETDTEYTTEVIITNGNGERVSRENALKQFQDLNRQLLKHKLKEKELDALGILAKSEKIPMKKKFKALGQWKDATVVKAAAAAQVTQTIAALGRNISTLIKMKKN